MKLIALILPGLMSTTAVPETFQSFKADVEASLKTTLGGMTTDIVITGKIFTSARLQRVRNDFKKIVMKIDMGDMSGGGLDGGMDMDLSGGGLDGGMDMDLTGRRRLLQNMDMELNADGTELLRYDLKKNFTWGTGEGGTVVCTCEKLEGEMNQLFVDPSATAGGTETITINEASVSAKKYTSSLSMGLNGDDAIEASIVYHVEGDTTLRQVHSTFKVGAGSDGITSDDTLKFWNVEVLTSDAWSQPHANCKCPEADPPKKVIAPSYPAAATASAGCGAEAGCSCIKASTTSTPSIEFCKDIVTWPIKETLFVKTTDDFVKTAHTNFASGGTYNEECKTAYKEFLCKFYFEICSKGGKLAAPPAFDTCTIDSTETKSYSELAAMVGGDEFSAGFTTSPVVALALSAMAAALL